MKYADFKLAAVKGLNPSGKSSSVILMAKKKNGLFFLFSDRAVHEYSSFTFFLGGAMSIATLKEDYVEIAIPEKEELLKVKLMKEDEIDVFMSTDYHGFEI